MNIVTSLKMLFWFSVQIKVPLRVLFIITAVFRHPLCKTHKIFFFFLMLFNRKTFDYYLEILKNFRGKIWDILWDIVFIVLLKFNKCIGFFPSSSYKTGGLSFIFNDIKGTNFCKIKFKNVHLYIKFSYDFCKQLI